MAGTAGLTEVEAQRRLAGRGRPRRPAASRSYASIVRANLLNLPNGVLGLFGGVTVALGELADALFLGIVVANTVVGSVQEIRAKRALERLAALVQPVARVVRDGRERLVDVGEVVVGDLVALQPGDQVVADGSLTESAGLRLDESVLTGESRPVARAPGEPVLSGSFAVEGTGRYRVEAVGAESYAERIAGEARAFRHPPSPFQLGLNRLIVALVLLGVPLVLALTLALWLRQTRFDDALPTVVASAITLVPEGLILLSSIAYATSALKLSRHGALVQQLPAVEALASADVVCTDKTGTLTEARLRVAQLVPAPSATERELARALGSYAAGADVRNATVLALAAAFPAEPLAAETAVPFSSRRRWGAVRAGGETVVLGAPELFPLGALAGRASGLTEAGRRVLAVAAGPPELGGLEPAGRLPAGLRLLGLAALSEELRSNASETVAYLRRENVAVKVLSGDSPRTVGAIAEDAGIVSEAPPLDGRTLPREAEELAALVGRASVVGRIEPQEKRRVVEALAGSGLSVVMIGDGVNDVPALKASQVAIAQGTGSQMARSVSDVVLVEGDFAVVPRLVAEGRQILRNLARVSKIYATKALFGAVLVLALGLPPIPFPFLPRHLSLASFFVTGVPPFFLALAPSSGPWRLGSYLRDVARFALPAACALGAGVSAAYVLALEALDLELVAARTVALSTFIASALYVIFALEATSSRRARWVGALCSLLLVLYAIVPLVPALRDVFEVVEPGRLGLGMIALGVGLAVALLAAAGIRPRLASSARGGGAPTRR